MTWSARATVAAADHTALITLDAGYCVKLLPRRDPGGHKGTFGTVLCIAGSPRYVGAALLTASAAVRGGAGLVALAVPSSLQPTIAGRVPEAITLPLPENPDGDVNPEGALLLIDRGSVEALVIGPGLQESDGNRAIVVSLLARNGAPIVVDGTGLTLLSASGDWWTRTLGKCVLTPHPGEFERLTGARVGVADSERQMACAAAAVRFGQVVVLKGAYTIIADPEGRIAHSPFANPALATAGSGDVLAGLTGALLAQGVQPFDAACLGVYLHARAGERISRRLGDAGLAASDLPLEIAMARHELSTHLT